MGVIIRRGHHNKSTRGKGGFVHGLDCKPNRCQGCWCCCASLSVYGSKRERERERLEIGYRLQSLLLTTTSLMPGYSRDYMYSNRGKRHSGERHQTRRHASVLRTTIMSVYTHTHGPFVYTARVLCVCRFSRRKKRRFLFIALKVKFTVGLQLHCANFPWLNLRSAAIFSRVC
jgi:hypothetical protein